MNFDKPLDKIAICLVEPTGTLNIGSVARAMKNMGFSRLIIVGGVDPDTNETREMASGAYDIIENATFAKSVPEAIAPFGLVAATSRRSGKNRRPTHFLTEYPPFLLPKLEQNEAVILFGSERSGLTTEDIDFCQHRIFIPTSPEHASLNLAQAVMVVCYEIARAANPVSPPPERRLATSQEMEGMYGHIQEMLLEVGFLDSNNPAWIMRAVRNILDRSELDDREVKIVRGALSDIDWYINHCIKVGQRDGYREKK